MKKLNESQAITQEFFQDNPRYFLFEIYGKELKMMYNISKFDSNSVFQYK